MNKLDQAILDEFGIDTLKLMEEYQDIVNNSVPEEYKNIIQALATYIFVCTNSLDAQGWWGAVQTLFAVGYKAGRDAPDLSVFDIFE